ncbi:MAG: hypothetical protein IME93_01185 [Proteobacteria bacterium]|nr:hypothetical protein [Pseudomonadota bacterium]
MAKQPGRRKPSKKHTLQEVTSTLQDLVNNELSDASLRLKTLNKRVKDVREDKPGTDSKPESASPGNKDNGEDTEDPDWIAALGEELEVLVSEGQTADLEEKPEIKTETDDKPDNKSTSETTAAAPEEKQSGDQLDIWNDDIPVLREVASPPPAAEPQPAGNDGQPSTKERAHKLAIRAIAKLNIELRKRGKPELEALLVNRLQRILEQELDQ